MKLKAGVKLDGVKSELLVGLLVADSVWHANGYDMTVTAIKDGQHKVGSLHYKGWAADLRTKDLPSSDVKRKIISDLRAALTQEFDIVFEDEGGDNEHVHLEWDVA